ncbi:hypothetical protein [Roseomonas xinghualingensis]|uniref:hypothetical protein n=1 Tax=Roseomonas xinghualingensis TaxID=2986475 RepID=UPI0021F1A44A|nr:hypothetical protein [Roseomonas sp. SXEYE001]MCV4208565.1 hypothetical protein [Roseomonas sp. SXEYE001]
MLVYGDAPRREDPRRKLAELANALRELASLPPGICRHSALAAALIEAGELAQGIADADFAERGVDDLAPAPEAAMALLVRIAEALCLSWNTGFTQLGAWPEAEWAALATTPLPGSIRTKRAEGFAYYALYPEVYAMAAASLPSGVPLRVIGLRSIGVTLAAMVAARLGGAPPRSLRPVGHPFRRKLAVSDALAADLLAGPEAHFAVVDEGPGLSGSSFGAVIEFLEGRGVPLSRIHLLPGHGDEPGSQASPELRARWAQAQRHSASFEDLLLHAVRPEHRLESWAADLLGAPDRPLEDISGGAWRRLRSAEVPWPPIHPFMERRKFLFHRGGTAWLLKFAGLGHRGEKQAEHARLLHAAGFTPEVAGFRHGFLIERWMEEARPLDPARYDRSRLIAHLGRYLAFRARSLPAGPEGGASAEALWEMARHNTAQALGQELAARMDRWKPSLPSFDAQIRWVWTDNRLHAWEWLVLPDGRLLKTDAVDHAAAHDLIGCQDIAWDVAGAVVELGLSSAEQDRLGHIIGQESGRAVDPELLAFLTPCYLAFQLGYHAMAADASGGEEVARAGDAAARYAEALKAALLAG